MTGKQDTTTGASDDGLDLVLFLGFSEDSAFMASLETRDKEEGKKQLKKAEKRAIVVWLRRSFWWGSEETS